MLENALKLCEEQGENRSWDVQRGRKNDANISDGHFVDIGIANNDDQELHQRPQQGQVRLGEPMNKSIECDDLLFLFSEFYIEN